MSIQRGLSGRVGEHRVEHLLHRQGVRATARGLEEMTVAMPRVGIERHGVGAVVAGEAGAEGLELHAVGLVRIAHCLLDLADHARMHRRDYLHGAAIRRPTTWRPSARFRWPWRGAP